MVTEGVRSGGRFPVNMKALGQLYNLTFNPENGDHALMVPSPGPGDWFMFAFVNERTNQDYVQKTTSLRCSTWLRSEAEYQLERDVFHLYPERHRHTKLMLFHNVERPQTYK